MGLVARLAIVCVFHKVEHYTNLRCGAYGCSQQNSIVLVCFGTGTSCCLIGVRKRGKAVLFSNKFLWRLEVYGGA